jgi:putative acetyltransferase
VLLGKPAYYGRFGFDLRLEAVPPQYFMARAFVTALPRASVTYHPAFNPERNPHVPR